LAKGCVCAIGIGVGGGRETGAEKADKEGGLKEGARLWASFSSRVSKAWVINRRGRGLG